MIRNSIITITYTVHQLNVFSGRVYHTISHYSTCTQIMTDSSIIYCTMPKYVNKAKEKMIA